MMKKVAQLTLGPSHFKAEKKSKGRFKVNHYSFGGYDKLRLEIRKTKRLTILISFAVVFRKYALAVIYRGSRQSVEIIIL